MWETLSLEIIFEIFGHFLPGLKLSFTKPHQFPWYLGQVCMTWRNAFLAFTQLWNTLDIDLRKQDLDHNLSTSVKLTRRLGMLEESLLRSRNHTISFRFTTVRRHLHCSGSLLSHSGQFLDRLVARSSWRDAYLKLHLCEAEALYRVKNRLPMLRSLQCTFVQCHRGTEVMQDVRDLLVDAPRLTRISLDNSIKWNIDWSSITSIHFILLEEVTYLLSCLKQARRLEELAIRSTFRNLSPNTISPITLPSLKVLHVCDLGSLLLFETPALEELYVSYGGTPNIRYEWIASSYIGSLRHLRKLSIFPWNDVELKQLIQYLPAAQDLYVQCINPDLFKLLPACRKACEVRTLTFALSLRGIMGQIATECLSRTITGWKKKRHGFGPFTNLTTISVVFLNQDSRPNMSGAPPHVLDSLRRHFEDQGIRYSIQQHDKFDARSLFVNETHVSPQFDTL